jgi:hypothetical protein
MKKLIQLGAKIQARDFAGESLSIDLWLAIRVDNFRQKNYSAEDGIDGTIGFFRPNSSCSAGQKTLGIPFRTINARNSVEANSPNSIRKNST